jgi:RNA polymerase sigma factor (sigma-70 family)
MDASVTGDDDGEASRDRWRWEQVWAHHDRLLRYARRRTLSEHDAEDVVAEALLRAMEGPEVDDVRLPGWLTTVTARLCADLARERTRERRRWARAGLPASMRSSEEQVCERAEAAWVADRVAELPPRQQQVLRLRAEGLDLTGVARCLGVSYRSAESLLARARKTARAALASTLAPLAAVLVWRNGRWVGGLGVSAVSVAVAVTLSAVVTQVPFTDGGDGTGPRPPRAVHTHEVTRASHPQRSDPAQTTAHDAALIPSGAGPRRATGRAGARPGGGVPTGALPASSHGLGEVPSLTSPVSAPTAPSTRPVTAPSPRASVDERRVPSKVPVTTSTPHVTSAAVPTDSSDGRRPRLRYTG